MRLTPDATRSGRPLGPAAWAAHLALLHGVAAGQAPDFSTMDRHEIDAWIALKQAGLVCDSSTCPTDGSFRWARWELTAAGRVYLAQRT